MVERLDQIGGQPAVYALEGSIAMAGSLVQWLRDNLGMITHAAEIEELASQVADNGGCYIVPAFSGLFAPHWRSDARGIIAGLTSYVTKAHLARAVLEATAAAWPAVRRLEVLPGQGVAAATASGRRMAGGGPGPELRVVLYLEDGLDAAAVQSLVGDLHNEWSRNVLFGERVDSVEVKLRRAEE